MDVMYKSADRQDVFYFRVSCSDWENIVVAKDFSDAANLGLKEMLEKFKKNLNLSFTIVVAKILENEILTEFFYTPKVLSDIGLHKLSKEYDEFYKNLLDKN